ncbi:MAG: aldo/keto reductase [Bacteroidia bacterium 44-10]|nr:MAG: aldo/keto reductase [Bacteroidia bacterium 44-10]
MTFSLGGDLTVNRLGFGAMRLPSVGGMSGPPRSPETSRAVLRRAVELGVNLIDTANFYGNQDGSIHANTLIRETLYPYPSNLVIATKVGPNVDTTGRPLTPLYGPASDLRAQVEANLEALRLDRLDLVYLRVGLMGPPQDESIAEHFEMLAKLREEGLIRHLGLSNVDVNHIAEARAIAPVAAVQNYFNIIRRDGEDVLDFCAANHIAYIPFGPLGSGGREDLHTDRVTKVAVRHDATVYQIALAWLLAYSPVTLAIPGTGRVDHLEENWAARSIVLSKQDMDELA